MKKNKITEIQKSYDRLRLVHRETSDYLLDLIEDNKRAEDELRYLNEFIQYKKLEDEFQYFKDHAHEECYEDLPFPYLTL